MKTVYCLALALVIAACSAPQEDGGTAAAGGYDADNLATSQACFADTPSAHLEPGQTLIERGPSGVVLVSHARGGAPADYAFNIVSLPEAQRQQIDAAAADFFRAAGELYDVTTDAVIYHRSRDGAFCAVVRDDAAGQALVDAAEAVDAARPEATDE